MNVTDERAGAEEEQIAGEHIQIGAAVTGLRLGGADRRLCHRNQEYRFGYRCFMAI